MAVVHQATINYSHNSIVVLIESGDDWKATYLKYFREFKELVDTRDAEAIKEAEKEMDAVDVDKVKDFKGDPVIIAKTAIGDKRIEGESFQALHRLEVKYGGEKGQLKDIPTPELIKFLIVHGIKGE